MNIETYERELIDLQKQGQGVDVQKARLLWEVKENKLFKDKHGSFSAFADHIGYSRVYCYDLVKVYDTPVVRQAWEQGDIGTMSAVKIAKSSLPEELMGNLIEYACDHTAREVVAEVKRVKAELNGQGQEQEQDDNNKSLPELLKEQTGLLNRKSELEQELREIESRLAELYPLISQKAE